MIYEFKFSVGSLPIVIEKFQEKIDGRNNISKIGAFWYTEIGPLNQIIHVWPYDSIEHRNNSSKRLLKKNYGLRCFRIYGEYEFEIWKSHLLVHHLQIEK